MRCAAPLSATSLPSMAPSPRMSEMMPSVSPMPFSMESTAASSAIPSPSATASDTMMNATNELSLKPRMSTSRSPIPRITISSGMVVGL